MALLFDPAHSGPTESIDREVPIELKVVLDCTSEAPMSNMQALLDRVVAMLGSFDHRHGPVRVTVDLHFPIALDRS